MSKRMSLMLLAVVLAFCVLTQVAWAQGTSTIDTFKVQDVTVAAGSVVPIKLFVVNDSMDLSNIFVYFRIDTNVVKYAGIVDSTDPNAHVFQIQYNQIERGVMMPPLFEYAQEMRTSDSVTSVYYGIGWQQAIPRGRGNIMEFWVKVKDGLPNGTTTQIRLYNPLDPNNQDYRVCTYTDSSGTKPDVEPTLVSGTLTIGTVVPGHNSPPTISPISQTTYNVQLGNTVNFNVTATDPDSPQKITLIAGGLPSGATFGSGGQVTGNGAASGTFNWPNIQQVGNFTITFTCHDDSSAWADPPRSVTINVGTPAPTEDILYSPSSINYRAIAGGIPGLLDIPIPINLNNLGDVYGVQFDFVYNSSAFSLDSLVPTERLTDFTVYENLADSPGHVKVVAFGLNNQKVQPGTVSGTTIFKFWASVRPMATVGESKILFEDAWESVNPNPSVASVQLKFDTTGVFVVDELGDVNGDRRVDVADLVVTVGYIIGDHTLTRRQFSAADFDKNVSVDVIDLVSIINQIFGGVPPNVPQWNGKEAVVQLGDGEALVNGSTIDVNVDFPTNIAGVQLEINYNPEKVHFAAPQTTELSSGLYMRYKDYADGKLIVLLYPRASSKTNILPGSGTMLKLPLVSSGDISADGKDVQLTTAVLSDPNAAGIPVKGMSHPALPSDFTLNQNFPNPFNPETTIEFAVSAGMANKPVRLVVFNLLGEKVSTLVDEPLAAGKYTFKWRGSYDNGETAPSGVYFYRLTVGDRAETRKMVLMK